MAVRRAQAQDEARAKEIVEINRSTVQTREDVRAAEMFSNNSTSQGPGIEPPNFYSTTGSRRDGSGHPMPLPLHMTPHHALLHGSNHVGLHNHHHHPHHPHLSHHHPAHHHLAVTAAASQSASVVSRLRPIQNSVDDDESGSTPLPIITSPPMSSRGKGGCSDTEMDSVDNKSTEGGRSISRSTTDRESVRGRSPRPIAPDHRRKSSPINVGSGSNSITPSTSAASSILASKMFSASRERGSSGGVGTGSTSSALIRSAAAAVGWPPLIDPLFAKHHHHGTNGTNVNTLLALPSSVGNGGGSGSAVTSPTSMAAMAAAAAAVSCGVDPTTAHFGALKMYPHFGKLIEIVHFFLILCKLSKCKQK